MRLADLILTGAYKPRGPLRSEQDHVEAMKTRHLAELGLTEEATEADLDRVMSIPGNEDKVVQMLNEVDELERNAANRTLEAHRKYQRSLGEMFKSYPIVLANNVYVHQRTTDDRTQLLDMPCLAPKWPMYWTEWNQRNGQQIGVLAIAEAAGGVGHGSVDNKFRPAGEIVYQAESDLTMGEVDGNGLVRYENGLWTSDSLDMNGWEDVRWVWTLQLFVGRGKEAVGPFMSWKVALDPHGKPLDMMFQFLFEVDGADGESLVTDFARALNVWGMALSFLNCRNVQTEYREPSPGEQRKHRKKRKATNPLVGYHLIKIQPTGTATRIRSGPGSGQGTDAFHIHPGSIAHYGDCCPGSHPVKGLLFGKLTGIYYRPMHLKGNPAHGERTADYRVDAPR